MSNKLQHRTFDPKRIQQNFADASGLYDYWVRATESKATRRVLEIAGINENESILEAGVGTCILFEKITRKNARGLTVGIDLSPDMLVKAKKPLEVYKG